MTDDQILARILDAEGGFVNLAADKGGATNWGITRGTLAEWRRQPVTVDDVRQLTVAEASAIYTARYLAPFAAMTDGELKAQVVDIAVNSGVTTARALLAVASQQTTRPVRVQLVIERLRHYGRICKAKPDQTIFLGGWIARATSFLALMLWLFVSVLAQDGGEVANGQPVSSLGSGIPHAIGMSSGLVAQREPVARAPFVWRDDAEAQELHGADVPHRNDALLRRGRLQPARCQQSRKGAEKGTSVHGAQSSTLRTTNGDQ